MNSKELGISEQELRDWMARFPYFQLPHSLLAKQTVTADAAEHTALLNKAATLSFDRNHLCQFLNRDFDTPIYKEEIVLQTVETIPEPQQEPLAEPQPEVIHQEIPIELEPEPNLPIELPKEELITEPIEQEPETIPDVKIDYSTGSFTFEQWLALFSTGKQPIEPPKVQVEITKDTDSLELNKLIESSVSSSYFVEMMDVETNYSKGLNTFIDQQKHKNKGTQLLLLDKEELEAGNSKQPPIVSETLAKIYVQQQKYAKAIECYQLLALKYPKKSALFAAQIKELELKL